MKSILSLAAAALVLAAGFSAQAETVAAAVVANGSTFQVVVKNTIPGEADYATSATVVTSERSGSVVVTGSKLLEKCPSDGECTIIVRQLDGGIAAQPATVLLNDKLLGVAVLKTAGDLGLRAKPLVDASTGAEVSTCSYSDETSLKRCTSGHVTAISNVVLPSGSETTALMTGIGYEFGATGAPLVTANGNVAGMIIGGSPAKLATAMPASTLVKLVAKATKTK